MNTSRIRPSRVRRWCVTVIVVTLAVTACTSGGGPSDDPAADVSVTAIPPASTLLRVGLEAWPRCLNPLTCDTPELRDEILQHVLPVAFELSDDNELVASPLLDGNPEVAPAGAGMEVTYRISPDARWNDGRPVTSSDFRATWEAIMATPGADTTGYDQITVVDDADPLVAQVRFASPYGDWQELFGAGRGWILEGDALGPTADLTGRFRSELPFSAGPYRLATWDGDSAVLTRNDDYWVADRDPKADQVRLVRVSIDDLVDPAAFDVLVRKDAPGSTATVPDGFDERAVPTTSVLGVWFDRRTPLLQPRQNRQVLATLTDRAALGRLVDRDASDPINCLGWLPDVGPWCEAARVTLPDYDPDLASFALSTLGWTPDPSGVLTLNGQPFAIPIAHDPDVPASAGVADALSASVAAAGIGVDDIEIPISAWRDRRGPDQQTGVGVYPIDLGLSPDVTELYGCLDGDASSRLGWCEPEVVDKAQALLRTASPDARRGLVARIGTIAGDDVAWLPIAQLTTTSYVRSGIVTAPKATRVVGGALAELYRFEVDR